MEYLINVSHNVEINNNIILTNKNIVNAINFCNTAIRKLYEQTKEFDINIFEILGMRNLSGMVGEYFAKSIQIFRRKFTFKFTSRWLSRFIINGY